MVEHFHGKEGVQGSIPCLGSSIDRTYLLVYSSKVMKRLTLSTTDKKVSGLCGGIAEYADIDVTVVRLIVFVATVMTGVLPGLFIYAAASAIVPKPGEIK